MPCNCHQQIEDGAPGDESTIAGARQVQPTSPQRGSILSLKGLLFDHECFAMVSHFISELKQFPVQSTDTLRRGIAIKGFM